MMNPSSNLDINRHVRRVLVQHWVDLGRLSIHTVNSSVNIRGSLHKLPGSESRLTSPQVAAIFQAIKLIAEHRSIHAELDNWFYNSASNSWEPSESRDRRVLNETQQQRTSAGTAFQISEEG